MIAYIPDNSDLYEHLNRNLLIRAITFAVAGITIFIYRKVCREKLPSQS